ncbi:hypothetical protein ACFWMG_32735 [Streptomyces sp. NPDC127074]|uniref:hypothetical protein n=1 Tax=Streptomyces sp. NPDC127074 TaxID=3347130 RepID=UPI003646096A
MSATGTACQEAWRVRERVFEEWRGAVASLHRARRLLSPFGFLAPWAANAIERMGGRRKGRDDVLEYARDLVSSWAEAAEAAGHAEGPEEELLARLPEQRKWAL